MSNKENGQPIFSRKFSNLSAREIQSQVREIREILAGNLAGGFQLQVHFYLPGCGGECCPKAEGRRYERGYGTEPVDQANLKGIVAELKKQLAIRDREIIVEIL